MYADEPETGAPAKASDRRPVERSDRRPSRRSLLRAVAVASGSAALAGCTFEVDDGITISRDSDDGADTGAGNDAVRDGDDAGNGDSAAEEGDDDSENGTEAGSNDTEEGAEVDDDSGDDDTIDEDVEDDPKDEDVELDFSEDCLDRDSDAVEIEEVSGGWRLNDGSAAIAIFDEFENAQRARDIIRGYGLDSRCFIGRPNPPLEYWLADGAAPVAGDANVGDEDCIAFDRTDLEIVPRDDGKWWIAHGSSALFLFENKENAERTLDVIDAYQFNNLCFVGRPDPPVTYLTR